MLHSQNVFLLSQVENIKCNFRWYMKYLCLSEDLSDETKVEFNSRPPFCWNLANYGLNKWHHLLRGGGQWKYFLLTSNMKKQPILYYFTQYYYV